MTKKKESAQDRIALKSALIELTAAQIYIEVADKCVATARIQLLNNVNADLRADMLSDANGFAYDLGEIVSRIKSALARHTLELVNTGKMAAEVQR